MTAPIAPSWIVLTITMSVELSRCPRLHAVHRINGKVDASASDKNRTQVRKAEGVHDVSILRPLRASIRTWPKRAHCHIMSVTSKSPNFVV